jgi:hypothetical protein
MTNAWRLHWSAMASCCSRLAEFLKKLKEVTGYAASTEQFNHSFF